MYLPIYTRCICPSTPNVSAHLYTIYSAGVSHRPKNACISFEFAWERRQTKIDRFAPGKVTQ